ncbi:MAG: hypothetical protein M1324_01220 [Patescibacteria group bacterium]|nr:hypothetical protein [Patescibacteria group bacterium]
MKVYLDVDETILANNKQKANFADEFIRYLVENHNCYWLSTNVKGDTDFILNRLKEFFDKRSMDYIRKIKPTNWKTWKTEAIDFNNDFRWYDDYLFEEEIKVLKEKNRLDSWIKIDLTKNPNQLKSHIR